MDTDLHKRFYTPLHFAVCGKIRDTEAFERLLRALDEDPDITPVYVRKADRPLYIVSRREAAKCGALRKRRGPEP